jgi:hypothetical protein
MHNDDAKRGLAKPLQIERYYRPDRNAMLAALRVALGLPRAPLSGSKELGR